MFSSIVGACELSRRQVNFSVGELACRRVGHEPIPTYEHRTKSVSGTVCVSECWCHAGTSSHRRRHHKLHLHCSTTNYSPRYFCLLLLFLISLPVSSCRSIGRCTTFTVYVTTCTYSWRALNNIIKRTHVYVPSRCRFYLKDKKYISAFSRPTVNFKWRGWFNPL